MTPALRRGLPRVPGGEPWPPPGEAPVRAHDPVAEQVAEPIAVPELAPATVGEPSIVPVRGGVALRRGLPRVPGGEPWPPAGLAPVVAAPEPAAAPEPVPATRSPRPAWLRRGAALGGAAILVAVAVVLVARWLVGLDAVADFIVTYPGTYPLPEGAPVGIPAWLGWQHFFNVFLLVLIVRTGLEVRRQARPPAYWAPRGGGERIGLTAWTHQALDIFWVVNGAAYIVLLFATGQWMRIVPTSWDVFPNALSAVLQYLSLDFPAHDSWAYYNSLQQIFYFLTVFVAAPLAIVTGLRMSMWWREGGRADRFYPKAWARALHFPVMIYFVAFVIGHVGLVLATGARENLNHMYASRDDSSWVGVVIFLGSLLVIAAAVAALRPLLVAPVAGRFGTVTER